jgi:predicted ATPase
MAGRSEQRSARIRTPDQRLRVFVSSVPGELGAERAAARDAIEQLRLAPVMLESGAQPHRARDVYRAYLEQSDVFVGIYWQQYGRSWPREGRSGGPDAADGAGPGASGLEDEFRLSQGMPRLLYVKRPAPDAEPELSRMLTAIQAEGGLAYKPFSDAAELRELLLTDLVTILTERFEGTERGGSGYVVPSPATALVGREHDVAEVVQLLDKLDRRLVVLTGAGGIGKTRLAVAVMLRSKELWRDGIAFVDLSSVTSPESVPGVIATSLGLAMQGQERPLDVLGRRLAGRHMLLVLDNFEQVLDAAPLVADLLSRAPRLHVLVTSRVVLRVRGEQEWRVEPLGLVPTSQDLAALAEVPAVRLFVDRVRDVRPGFELTDENAADVAELCRRLDGLPLALELAAAWMRLLTPAQMLARLEERLGRPGVLVDLPNRQKTLTATIEWSYDLLPEAAQKLLPRLSAFAAPFTADAVDAICGRENPDMMEDLSTLLDHSMVSPAERPDGQPAFQLLDTIRRFAAARLDADAADETFVRLERYLLDVLANASTRHGSQRWAMRGLDSELLNIQAVFAWRARDDRMTGALVRALGDVWVWLLVRGHLRRASVLGQQIGTAGEAGFRTERDRMAWSFLQTSRLLVRGRFDEVVTLVDEVVPDFRRLEGPSRLALTLMRRGMSRPYMRDSPARADFEEALAVIRDTDDDLALGYVLSHYGSFLSVDGNVAKARRLHGETLKIARSLNDENQRAEAHYELAIDGLLAGESATAEPDLVLAARHYRDIDHRDGLARCLAALSVLALSSGHADLAAWLIGATSSARDDIGLTPWPLAAEAERRFTAQVQAGLPAAEYADQVASGRTHLMEDALGQALLTLEGTAPVAQW